ncbi:MAG: NAD(P)H-binding protein [Acidobacteriia bacterium]|nr:NAD(P)H-binding protein [Terriglobia bacterium]
MHDEKAGRGTVTITGAFSYTGKYVAQLLLDRGYRVRTLTGHPGRENPFGQAVGVFPYDFDRPDQLRKTLLGTSTLINTYWVRFPRGELTFETAVRNTRTLIEAAKDAGVGRIVHVSIANPSAESPLAYYRGKAELEQAVIDSGLSYTIVRPTVIFGEEDILINNIAWFVRRFPVFGIPGDGRYRIRPIYVEDMARIMAEAVDATGNAVIDAVGPETYTFDELVRLIARSIGRSVRFVHVPAGLAYLATLVAGWLVGDVVLTWEEYRGLMGNLLAPEGPTAGSTRLSEWLSAHQAVGMRYASEVARHYTPAGIESRPLLAKPFGSVPKHL